MMKKKLKKIVASVLSCVLCFLCTMPVYAHDKDSKDESKIYVNELEISKIQVNGFEMYVPVQKIENNMSTYSNSDEKEAGIDYYIPVTEKAKQYNNKLISDMKAKLTSSNQSMDTNGYVTVTSNITFSRDSYNGNPRIKMSSFRLTKNRNLDSTLIGIQRPKATVYQLGYYGPGGHPEVMDQTKTVGFEWGSSVSVPSSWLPVCINLSSHLRGVQYNLSFIYKNGTTSTCDFFHPCN